MSGFESPLHSSDIRLDPVFQHQVQRLHQLNLYGRWLTVSFLWLFVAPLSLWNLRHEISLWLDYFTWTAVRYALLYNRLPAFGLALCIAMTISVLLWQSHNFLFGLPPRYRHQLEKQVLRIRRKGNRHFLWRWVCKP